ncbi:hypothetical protein ACQJBY_005444 [Aegilops geniculata]
MAKRNEASLLVLVAMAVVVFLSVQVKSEVAASTPTTYTTKMQEAVRNEVKNFLDLLPGLIRLLFHDCFVNGCDGSVLLETSRINGTDGKTEMTSPFNVGLRGLEVIQKIKDNVDSSYGITCTDAVIYVAREAVYLLSNGKIAYNVGGPGRKDGVISRSEDPGNQLPGTGPDFKALVKKFTDKVVFTEKDVVALSGAHAVGVAHRTTFIGGISDAHEKYQAAIFLEMGTKDAVKNNVRDFNEAPLTASGYKDNKVNMSAKGVLDNSFYNAVLQKMALFPSDRVLAVDAKTKVEEYMNKPDTWNKDFGDAMEKLSKLPATSDPSKIEIRKVCSETN